jgi:hypothetical protein
MSDTENTTEAATTQPYSQVKTSYARACIVLLALNFVLTGYCFLKISKYQGDQIDGLGETASQQNTVGAKPKPNTSEENKPTPQKED